MCDFCRLKKPVSQSAETLLVAFFFFFTAKEPVMAASFA